MSVYALVTAGQIRSVGGLPAAAPRLDTGQWVMPPQREWTDAQAAACGYLPVVDAARPADNDTTTHDRGVELVAGVPTVVWTARAWTTEEQAARELEVLRREQESALAALTPDQTNALLAATAPSDGEPWRQPTGAHDAYPTGRTVTHNGKTWENLTPANVWEPGVAGWREVTEGDDWPDWVQPTGAHDAYPLGAQVAHNGQHWINTGSDANTWEPGVFGWTVA